jgi:hypothetical protein
VSGRVEPRSRRVLIVRPLAAVLDSADPLNQPVANIVWTDVTTPQALEGVVRLLSGGGGGPSPSETVIDDRVFSVTIPSGTVLDVLVAAARAHGALVWQTPDPTQHASWPGLSVGVATFDGRGIGIAVPLAQ